MQEMNSQDRNFTKKTNRPTTKNPTHMNRIRTTKQQDPTNK